MFEFIIYLVFILCIAFSAGGIVLSSRLRNKYRHSIFSTLLYFQVFIFTFGFYGIWGQVVIKAFLSSYISEELINRFSEISMFLGLPFLVFAWLMLIQLSFALSGRKYTNWLVFWYLFVNISVIIVVGFIIAKTSTISPMLLMKNYYIAANIIYSSVSSLLILFPKKVRSISHDFDRKIIGSVLVLIMGCQCIPLFFYSSQLYIGIIFIFTFFAGNTFLPLYLNYGTLLAAFTIESGSVISFAEFCQKFDVSPRETDIVREICNGLSNKEIAEKLFISLQTVKDHSHRIYIKTNVKSRVQLITLVKDITKT